MPERAECQASDCDNKVKAALYIDAFNFYYAVNDLKQNHLKWIDLWRLGNILIPKKSERLVKVAFFTAYNKKKYDSLTRHQKYIKALAHLGVTCVFGHYISEPRDCKYCNHEWTENREKETDVNLALHLIHDARADVFQHAYLLTADSDQAATAKFLKDYFPDKKLTTVAPPGRRFSDNILRYADGKIALTIGHLERVVMPPTIFHPDGSVVVRRPDEYAPPQGWVHPNKRPISN